MTQMLDKSCTEFLKRLASNDPTPGGGGAAALVGAIAASLTSMVANLTIGKKKYAEVEEEIKEILASAEKLRENMENLVAKDAEVFQGFMVAFKMANTSDEDKKKRQEAIEKAAYGAAKVPMEIAGECLKVLELANKIVTIGNKAAITDATVSAFIARAALRSACYNVKINLGLIKDKEYVAKEETKMVELNKKALLLEEKVVQETDGALS